LCFLEKNYLNHSSINLYHGQPKRNKTKVQKNELTKNQIHIRKAYFHPKRKNPPLEENQIKEDS
jgi:hypothetical protein